MAVRVMIETGAIKRFPDIFSIIPKTIVARDQGINLYTMDKLIACPEEFSLDRMAFIAALIGVETEVILRLVTDYYLELKEERLRKVKEGPGREN